MIFGVDLSFKSQMRFKNLLILTALLLSLVASQNLQILYVSSSPTSVVSPSYGSYRGGTMIYIKAMGHSPVSSQNTIIVGTFPCIIPSDGVTDLFIACETTDSGANYDINNLPITLFANGQRVTTSNPNLFSYTFYSTPYLLEVLPAVGFASTNIQLSGYHRITDLGDGRSMGSVVKLKLGNNLCSLFDITQGPISSNSLQSIKCMESNMQEAGHYNVSEKLTPGFSNNDPYMRRSSYQQEYYEFAVLPTISGLTPASGNVGGQYLTIAGSGFSLNPKNNSVSVDGNTCDITSSTDSQITCTLRARDLGATTVLNTNSTSQQNGYASGSGLNYARYSISNLPTWNTATLKSTIDSGSPVLTVLEKGIRGEIKQSGYSYGSNAYAQVWKGYFVPPKTGTYTLFGSADDYFSVYIGTTYGSSELGASPVPVISGNQNQNYWNRFMNDLTSAEATLSLTAGKSYYIEVYHINAGGPGFIKVGASMPNTDTTLSFQTNAVHIITTNQTLQPEIISFTVAFPTGATATQKVMLRIIRIVNYKTTYDVNTTFAYNATLSTFVTALNVFDSYSGYQTSGVSQTYYDANSNIVATFALATSVTYVVSVYKLRPATTSAESFTVTPSGILTQTIITPHSPLISGTFSLSIGGVQIGLKNGTLFNNYDIPYNVDPNTLRDAFRNIVGFEKTSISLAYAIGCDYGCKWIISYLGNNNAIPDIIPNGMNLLGGSSGTTPTIVYTNRVPYSSNLLIDPIDHRFLNTLSSLPSVQVTVNNILSACLIDCSYTFMTSSEVTSLSVSSSTLNFALSDPNSLSFPSNSITVTVQGQPCIVDTATPLTALTCQLPTSGGNLNLVAGSVTPLVFVKNVGIISLASGITPISVPLTVTSISNSSGGNNGGYLRTISGVGFPTDISMITITACTNKATIKSSTLTSIIFYMPPCATADSQTITVQVGSLTDNSLSYSYLNAAGSAPTITSISPSIWNPALKGTLNIQGTGFGTDATQITVFLSNGSGKIYQFRVLNINDTSINAGIPGGLPGNYQISVTGSGELGDSISIPSNAGNFAYQVLINSVSPSTGSYNGGTLLTITGGPFSTVQKENLIFIGNTLNWMCSIETISATQISCRTPPISKDYQPGDAQKIVITTRLIVDNTCPGSNCLFSYISNSSSPYLSAISATSIASGSITLSGSLFTSGSACQISLTNQATGVKTVIAADTCSSTSATFTTPMIESGAYDVRVRSDPLGESNPLTLKLDLFIGIQSSNYGSIGGTTISYSGATGFPSSWPNARFAITMISNGISYPINVLSCSVNSFSLTIPAGVDGQQFKISFVSPNQITSSKTVTLRLSNTPGLTLTSTSSIPAGSNTITLNKTTLNTTSPDSITIYSTTNNLDTYTFSNSSFTTSGITITLTAVLNSGLYKIKAWHATNGWYNVIGTISVGSAINVVTNVIQSSFLGGVFSIQANYLSQGGYITVNNLRGNLLTYNSGAQTATYAIPTLKTPFVDSTFMTLANNQLPMGSFSYSGDQMTTNYSYTIDGNINTNYSSANGNCWMTADVGAGLGAKITKIKFFPYLKWAVIANYLKGAKFLGSNDNSTWMTLATVDQTVHTGWNSLVVSDVNTYRYIRFNHTFQSGCSIAQWQLFGTVYSTTTIGSSNLASFFSDVTYFDGANTLTFANSVQYRQDYTSTVDSVSPPYGTVFGGYNITLTGTNLNINTPTVVIDGIACTVQSSTATQIVCLAGARLTVPAGNSFTVNVGTVPAFIRQNFLYVMPWSDIRTWGTDLPPVDGDFIVVPIGMTLLVDQDTPNLLGISVTNGTLLFKNNTDITVSTGFITINGGAFTAGTEDFPFHGKLTFIMGGSYYGPQQPMFGNKGIGCMECKFSMYGVPRPFTWTSLASTVNIGDTTLTVQDNVDWQIGQQIVVASTSFDHKEAEQKRITQIVGKVITVDSSFKNKHFAGVQNYGTSDVLEMRAEVGLLSRNIKMMGDSDSVNTQYGSHLMMAGKASNGLVGHIAYTEFTHCGQPQILGRYCMHFHMNGDVPDSYVRGNAVHDSFARVVTIHGVHYLTVQDNVGYRVRGHNFFLEDGIETHNIIRHNLAISSLTVTNMLQTDISVASFWVTNPTNDLVFNHAAGGDFYGFWYEIKTNPDGPSATNDICPIGNPLGTSSDNVGHSYERFGLRIFKLYSRQFPCNPIAGYWGTATDPWAANPSIQSVFSNYILYKNKEDNVLAEQTGNVIFNNFTVAQCMQAGIEFYQANFTKEASGVNNSVIIGQSKTNQDSNLNVYKGGRGLITPLTGVTNFTNIRFYNFNADSTALATCSKCDNLDLFTNLGTSIYTSQIKMSNVSGNYLFMIGMKRDVIYDLDGSLIKLFNGMTQTSSTIMFGYTHITDETHCVASSNPTKWDNAVACDSTLVIRKIVITNLADTNDFSKQPIKVQLINTPQEIVSNISTDFTSAVSYQSNMEPMIEMKKSYSLPYVTGRIYNVWWGSGLDFSHISIRADSLFTPTDQGIILKFNYTANRQLYNVGPFRGNIALTEANYKSQLTTYPDPSTCSNGDYYHNNDATNMRMLTICASGKDKTLFQFTEVNAVICKFLCPLPGGTFTKEAFLRKWSNATQWPNGVLPVAGDNITVNGNWTVLLDMDPPALNNLTIDGDLVVDNSRDVNITAQSIFIRAGSITAGSPTSPFTRQFNIQLNGNKGDFGIVVDPIVTGNKLFAITGKLSLYGVVPASINTILTQTSLAGSSTIKVLNASGWNAGDQLAISPSFISPLEFEKVTIASISSDGVTITLTSPLLYTHYGAANTTINSIYGTLDARTGVGHLTRNIQIGSGPDNGWGFQVKVYGFMDKRPNQTTGILRIGQVMLNGVSFYQGGQYDTQNGPLQFLNIMNPTFSSSITASSFEDCKALCIDIKNSQNISISNNIFFKGRVFHTRVETASLLNFTNNLMIGAIEKPGMPPKGQLIACLATYGRIAPTDQVLIQNNICQGSAVHGFVFPYILCSELLINPLANNTAGSTEIGFVFNKIPGDCIGFSYIKAYANSIGQIATAPPAQTQQIFSNFILADNGRGATLRFGSNSDLNNTGYLQNSYITAISRPTCAECYGSSAIPCSGNQGVRMLAVTVNGETLPDKFGHSIDVICKQEVLSSRAYVVNVTFDNFRINYTGSALSQCSKNAIFRPHSLAHDKTASHNLFNTTCTNCQAAAYASCIPSNPAFLGWLGGCGDIMCTGKNNYLIQDHDGSLFGFKGVIIPNNTLIGSNTPLCTFYPDMNGHICQREDFGLLEYQSIAADFKTRIMWPVNLTFDGSNYTTMTNAWREWEWLGGIEPLNLRPAKFASIVTLQKYYNMTMTAMPPIDMQFQLSKRIPAGNNSDWIVVKLSYPLPNSIRIQVNGVTIAPVMLTDNLNPVMDTTVCGSNLFFFKNYTIHFVVTGDMKCLVRVSLTDTIQLTTHFDMNISAFYASNGITNYIDRLCALFNIVDTSRVKVVGVFTGSVQVVTYIDPVASAPVSSSGDSSMAALQSTMTSMVNSGAFQAGMASIGTVQSVSLQIITLPDGSTTPTQTSTSSVNIGLIIGVTLAGVAVIVTGIIMTIYCIRKRAKVIEVQQIHSGEDNSDFEQIEKDEKIYGKPSNAINDNFSNVKINPAKESKITEEEKGFDS